MAEKERYYCDKFEEIYDSRIDRYPSNEAICHILNNQIERIKNLEQENKQLKQSQKQLAIEVLEKMEDDLLDISSPYWQYFKSGNAFMTYEDIEQWTKEFIDNKIKECKGEE